MTPVVSNSIPLIYLAKVNKLDLLKPLFTEVFIPQEVKNEVVDKGKMLGKKDAYIVEKAITAGWLKVLTTDTVAVSIEIDPGEIAALSLAKKLKLKEVLIDESSARAAARLLDLTPRGTLFILLKALQKEEIDQDEFPEVLNQLLKEGFRLKEEVYLEALKEAKRITAKTKPGH
jgi:predicted nucleic acid-binding protein